ncbi:FtsX-like permease family protein [Pseudoflavitalea sp. X16]|uniref:ABC transporter permease n=1 Tax=Paraflavitalea devenefica TaxID=2716334 RepID=UPI0014204A49|nr:ABC transporter permease [Paraflavitalea devenefica]NII28008.1 FtsX-like permease family protein [Paraflavitalea devenefica]
MIKNYLKIAWRNLYRNKAYAFINVLGLSLGTACGILIFILITYHLSFDTFHTQKDRIHRLVTIRQQESITYTDAIPQPLGNAFRNDFTFAEKTARAVDYNNPLISLPNEKEVKKFREASGIVFAEPDFFDIFNFPLVKGDQKTALRQPNSAIITENIAKKYFGNDAPIGKTIRLNNNINFVITGILKDLPPNTDFRQEIYLSYANLKDHNARHASDSLWENIYSGSQCYILLKPTITAGQVNKTLPLLVKKYYSGRDLQTWQFRLQPLSDIHFNPLFDGYAEKRYLWALLFIGLFLLITACVNFVNLATAQALNRSKEVGVRKVLGSLRSQLFWQFITETTLITLMAVLLAYGAAKLALPYLNQLLESNMQLDIFGNWRLPVFLLLIAGIVIFLSGSYPGLVLARFLPVLALKGKLSQKHIGGISLRRLLVITQFAISQLLIIGTIVIASQMHYSKTTDLGFSKDAVIMLPVPVNDKAKMSTLHSRLAGIPGVEKISLCYQAPASGNNWTTSIHFDNRIEDESWAVNVKSADDQYLSTFGLQLVAGRNFYSSDTLRGFLVNETFVKKLNLLSPQDVIGKKIIVDEGFIAPVVGVVKDFHNYSLHNEITPVCIMPAVDRYANCAVKIKEGHTKTALTAFEKVWNETYPDHLYTFQFLDDRMARFYRIDNIMLRLIEIFACVAVFIGCLGLYGLVSFMAVRKTKEIGVRKVLGASVQQIIWLFGKELSRLLMIAFIIAAPFAWWVMNLYLEDFKYRIQIGAGVFLLAIICTFTIAVITVGYRSMRSALANPVKSLRSE